MKEYPIPKIDEGNFIKCINNAISEKRHVDYLRNVLKEYAKYKSFFEKVAFANYNPRGYVYQFKMTYKGDRKVWRYIEMKGNQNLEELADCIIDSMYWANDHMHRFAWPDEELNSYKFAASRYVVYYNAEGWEDDPHPTLKTNQIRIDDVDYEKFPKLYFEFDFGDSHEFDIEFKNIRGPKVRELKASFPRIIKENGEPPEQYPDYDEEGEYFDEEENELLSSYNHQEFQEYLQKAKIIQPGKNSGTEEDALKEYFHLHKKLPKNITVTNINKAMEALDGTNRHESDAIKLAILVLAHAGTEDALKALYRFRDKSEGKIRYWTDTAICECILFIDSMRN